MGKNVILIVALVAIFGIGAVTFINKAEAPTDELVGETTEDALGMVSREVISSSVVYYENISGYLAKPEGSGPFPALILIHEWWGLNDDIKSIADNFAKEGYIALAVDMYEGEVTTDPSVARTLSSAVRDDVEKGFKNLEGAIDYLRSLSEVDGEKLASVGWCFGGGWSYQMALNGLDIDASVMYYGQFNPDDDFAMMRGDILGHFGEEDASIEVDTVREFQASLQTLNGEHEVYIYPNVGHGFANLRGGDNLAYSEEMSELAWERTGTFLNKIFIEEKLQGTDI